MSTGAKVGIGCAVAILFVTILVCGGAITWYFVSWGMYQDFGNEFEQQGYTLTEDTAIDLRRELTGPHAFVAKAVHIRADIQGDVAIAARAGKIEGTIDGDLDFYGLALHIGPNAHITGDVRVRSAQAVRVEGTVDGSITGEWTVLEDMRQQPKEQP